MQKCFLLAIFLLCGCGETTNKWDETMKSVLEIAGNSYTAGCLDAGGTNCAIKGANFVNSMAVSLQKAHTHD